MNTKVINPSSLNLWYPFAEGSGSTTADKSGNGNTGTLVASPTWGTSPIGGGLTFNGTTQYVNAGTLGSFGSTRTNSTLDFLLKTTSTAPTTVFGSADLSVTGQNSFVLKLNAKPDNTTSTGAIRFTIGSNDVSPKFLRGGTTTNLGYTDGKWHRIVITAACATNVITLYIDGVAASVTYVNQETPAVFANYTANVYVAASNQGGVTLPFTGSIAQLRLYNRILSANEVAYQQWVKQGVQ